MTCEGRELVISERRIGIKKEEILFTYRLAGKSYSTIPREENPDFTGMSFVGTVERTQGEEVELILDIDRSCVGGMSYGFAPATGNMMYCMSQASTCEGTGDPEKAWVWTVEKRAG